MIKLYICCLAFIIGSVEVGPDMDIKFHQVVMKIVSYDKSMISLPVCKFILIMYTYVPFGKVSSPNTINMYCELPYWMVSMIKTCIGERLLLIHLKTLKCTLKNLCILCKKFHFYKFGCTDSPQ